MLKLNVKNETSRLRAVILGTAKSNGPVPTVDEAYDPKSLEHIIAGTYPTESDMIYEMQTFAEVLQRYGIQVYRPELIPELNQIFTRDIGFVVDDYFIKANILPDRAEEWNAIQYIIRQIDSEKFIVPPKEVHIEGGDVILWNDHIFIGTYSGKDYTQYNTARTNIQGVDFIRNLFPNKTVLEFDLIKSMTDARANALHLDCCFQPVGTHQAIIFKEGFQKESEYNTIIDLFGIENLFQITADEMYQMYSNVFSISPEIIVSEKRFTRLNSWLRQHGFIVEEIPYHEIGKQEGLLRCSTLPLTRD
ncbi:dimethylarginine dimethylaminohydrolase family protein [Sphingobacterium pedocola]|uniref:arginine deiminase n=1 Tax=Sphingobacterium pedocola TaxID=2082722 RepID=A0ABR9T9T8_9SPHI|nr:arginine deiminase family protein [Sphingobacterium pedocola]MBE8721402.1 amidinotransferase [Sphingobacterium pedocola]